MTANYNKMEMMICCAASYLKNGNSVAVGTGAPCAAAMLAQKTHAPNLVLAFEAGGLYPILPEMPISVGDSRTFYKANMAASMTEMMTTCARGMIDYAFIGGAQIDCYGNINSTLIGEYKRPKVRFPGSGGGNDFSSFCWRTIVMTNHNKSRFVENLDFLTSPGYLNGAGAREDAGLPADTGPFKIITDMAIMGFDDTTKRMKIESIHPEVDIEAVVENTGFELIIADDIKTTEVPNEFQLEILRTEIDPNRYIIGRS